MQERNVELKIKGIFVLLNITCLLLCNFFIKALLFGKIMLDNKAKFETSQA